MAQNAEEALLNHIINTKDIVTPLNANIGKYLQTYIEEWDWLVNYHKLYNEVPGAKDFFTQFSQIDQFDTGSHMDFYIGEVLKAKIRSSLQELLKDSAHLLRDKGPQAAADNLVHEVSKLHYETRVVKDVDLVGGSTSRLDSLRERIELRKSGKRILGVPTGISKLDEMYGGLQKGDFWVIAGNTGSLKSYLALLICKNAWLEAHRILYISLELSHEQVGYRFDTLVGMGEFSNSDLVHAKDVLMADRYKTWMEKNLANKPSFVVVTQEDLDDVTPNIVQAKIAQWEPQLVVVDYVALMDSDKGTFGETEKLKEISKALKRMASKTGVPIIAISAVTQEKKDIDKRPPKLHELAWSKQLGYDSDLCLTTFLQGDTLQVDAVKVRRSAYFRFFLNWDIDKGIVREVNGSINPEDYDDDIKGDW